MRPNSTFQRHAFRMAQAHFGSGARRAFHCVPQRSAAMLAMIPGRAAAVRNLATLQYAQRATTGDPASLAVDANEVELASLLPALQAFNAMGIDGDPKLVTLVLCAVGDIGNYLDLNGISLSTISTTTRRSEAEAT